MHFDLLRGTHFKVAMSEMPKVVEGALERILGDVERAASVRVRAGYSPPDWDGLSTIWLLNQAGGPMTGVSLPFFDDEDTIERLTHEILEQFFLDSSSDFGAPVPPCPGHTHALATALSQGTATWVCPATGKAVAPIGSLQQKL